MGKVVLTGLLLLGACRFGFEPEERPQNRAIDCAQTPRFTVTNDLTGLTSVATDQGFAVFAVDSNKALVGWTYEWDHDTLENVADYALLESDVTGGFGAIAIKNKILLAATHGAGATLATTYYPLSQLLDDRAPHVVNDQQSIGTLPLATASMTAEIRFQDSNAVVDSLDMLGAAAGVHVVADKAVVPSELSLSPAGSGFIASWVAATPTPNITQLAVLDEGLNVVATADINNTTGFDVIRPRVKFAALSKTYAVAWYEKTPTGGDDTFVAVFDKTLQPILPATRITADAVRPALSTDGNGFYIAYKDVVANKLAVSYVAPDGRITPHPLASTAAPTAWSMLERADQAVLSYADGAGNLWFAPMCN